MDEGSACAAIAIVERVNRFELGVCDGRLRQKREVGPLGESAEVLDRLIDPRFQRRDEVRPMW